MREMPQYLSGFPQFVPRASETRQEISRDLRSRQHLQAFSNGLEATQAERAEQPVIPGPKGMYRAGEVWDDGSQGGEDASIHVDDLTVDEV